MGLSKKYVSVTPINKNIDLMDKLIEDGIVSNGNSLIYDDDVKDYVIKSFENVLDYSKGNAEAYEKSKQWAIENKPMIAVNKNNYERINQLTKHGFKIDYGASGDIYLAMVRDYKPEELKGELSCPFSKNENGIKYNCTDLYGRSKVAAAHIISKTYPNIEFEYVSMINDIPDFTEDPRYSKIEAKGILKDGDFTPYKNYLAVMDNDKNVVGFIKKGKYFKEYSLGLIKETKNAFKMVENIENADADFYKESLLTLKAVIEHDFYQEYGKQYSLQIIDDSDLQKIKEFINDLEQDDERDDI